ncbi:MAG TPA: hypothetical protein VGO00_05185 [Kofleriaceae bacterium]|jgi:hypothetical protein|nr:hypothetical protein [Kofleriaceae bacterium]
MEHEVETRARDWAIGCLRTRIWARRFDSADICVARRFFLYVYTQLGAPIAGTPWILVDDDQW